MNKVENWKIESLTRENAKEAAKCLGQAFLLEPMTNSLHSNFQTVGPYFDEFLQEHLKQQDLKNPNHSYYLTQVLTAQVGEEKEVLGVISLLDYEIDIDINLSDVANSEVWDNVDAIICELHSQYEKYLEENGVELKEGKILQIYFVAVNPKYHRNGIGKHLMKHTVDLIKSIKQNDKSFPYERLTADLSSGGTQKIFADLNFKSVKEIAYNSFQNSKGEFPFIDIPAPSSIIYSELLL